jgi:hypothetical protein
MILGPLNCAHYFGDPDPAVPIGIDQSQGAFVEFEALDGAREGHPEFRIQVLEIPIILGGLESHLVKTPGTEETPTMRGC